jgi:GTP cyclohydrolase I
MTATDEDQAAVRYGVQAMLRLAGEDPIRPGLLRTPQRFLDAWLELVDAPGDPAVLLTRVFDDAGPIDQMVTVGPMEFTSICEHHLMPFSGSAWVAYLPDDGRVVGLSKLPRLVEHYARRPQIQERLTGQLTAALDKHVTALGSAALIKAVHSCASSRGVRKQAPMITSSLTGAFRNDQSAREEFMAWVRDA